MKYYNTQRWNIHFIHAAVVDKPFCLQTMLMLRRHPLESPDNVGWTVWICLFHHQVERPSRKRRDSFGMLDGLEEDRSSCSSESSGGSAASSPEDSEDEELGGGMTQLTPSSSSSSLTLIKTNGQVYTYPDGKAGMGQCDKDDLIFRLLFYSKNLLLNHRSTHHQLILVYFSLPICKAWYSYWAHGESLRSGLFKRWLSVSHICLFCSATCEMCGMVGVRDAFYSKTKRFCSVSCSRSYSSNSKKASILARLQVETQDVTLLHWTLSVVTGVLWTVWSIMKFLHLLHTYTYEHSFFFLEQAN